MFNCPKLIYANKNLVIETNIISDDSNSKRPILKIIKLEGERSDYIEKSFARPYYFPLSKTILHSIHIKLLNEEGLFIGFKNIVSLKLHFRKIKS